MLNKIKFRLCILESEFQEEVVIVAGRRGLMSDALKEELAKELGVYNTVKAEGWGSVSSRNCGSLVKKAIEMAERNMVGR